MQTLQIARHNSPSPRHPLILALSLSLSLYPSNIYWHKKIKPTQMKPPQGRLREECNRSRCVPVWVGVDGESLNTAAIMESLTATTELTAAAHRVLRWWKELLSVSSWVTWSNTSSPWVCGTWGVGGGTFFFFHEWQTDFGCLWAI